MDQNDDDRPATAAELAEIAEQGDELDPDLLAIFRPLREQADAAFTNRLEELLQHELKQQG